MNEAMLPERGAVFPPTRASMVQLAAHRDAPGFRAAWEEFFRAYAAPLYAWLRRTGSAREAALDLLQDFFAEGLEGGILRSYRPERGRLRTWLLACLRNQRLESVRRERARPEGAAVRFVGPDGEDWEPADPSTENPDEAFDHEWARRLLERSVAALAARWQAAGDAVSPRLLREWVLADERGPAAELAAALGISPGDLYTRATRLRQAISAEMLAQVRAYGGDGDAAAELEELLRALAR